MTAGPIDGGNGDRPIVRQCTGHVPSGRRCRRSANRGMSVCNSHGGAAPQTRAAAARRLAEAAVMAAGEKFSVNGDGPVDVLAELEKLVAIVSSFTAFATARVEALSPEQWGTFGPRTAAEVDVFRSALRDAGRLLTELARLGLVERQLAEQRAAFQQEVYQRAAVESARVLASVLADFGLNPADGWVREAVARQWRALPVDG